MPSKDLGSALLAAAFATAVSVAPLGATAFAEGLRIGTSYKLMTLDPHYADLNENTSLLSHIYERLVNQDEHLEPQPGLATSWRQLSPTQWEFKLRDGVRFHDGSPFTARDVVYSIERVRDFLKPPSGGFQLYVKGIKAVTTPDPLTVVIETSSDAPTLPLSLTSIFIMPHKADGFATTEELNSQARPVGTGPYKFDSWQSGEVLNLVRYDAYWGNATAWSDVTFRVIESPAARVAALSTGDVDIADYIPARDVEGLENRGLKVDSISAARSNFLQFDIGRDQPPGVTGKSGDPIKNPFRDKRVRQALTMATDRAFLADRILLGYGTAAAQLFPPGLSGTSVKLKVEAPDYDGAKKLLAEAGFSDGFNVMLAGPAGRYPGDSESLQAIAQNWARIGISVQPVVAPFSVFATQRSNGDYPVWYGGCSGEAVTLCLDAVLASPNTDLGTGSLNYGKYHNESFDEMLVKAKAMEAGPERNESLARATELVMADYPILPLYHFHLIVGHGQKVGSYAVHPRGWTTAMQATPSED
ncbi:ABC transporter substrate-binding protein [Rhizobiaceae bacterium n13]|uniref:ABC transporter substrate-binding protein n=1 Tax=Ferirhizobium litorale TaxID=2927786 RepID=A0AAE3QGA3_9HYPH|nr:ABC transporter substrate-binding protein [Fererhizobium litorale]MDI7861907.1 ABC transporter substrate-binding protein [Fererhizobium litorale]MDI7922821.1 ABC transporter substrate-binding protein [Fererhizobium litorale]